MMKQKIIDKAREYINTPWLHQGRSKLGVDCVGLIVCVFKDCGITVEDYTKYHRTPHSEDMLDILNRHLEKKRLSELEKGDIITIRIRGAIQHVAIYNNDTIIHADNRAGKVLEIPMTGRLRERIIAAHTYK